MLTKRRHFLIGLIVVLLFIGTVAGYAGERITCKEAGDNCKKDDDCDDASYGIDCIIHYCNTDEGYKDIDCGQPEPI